MWACSVSADLFVTVGALGQLGNLYGVMGPAIRCAPLRMAAFGIWHSFPSLSISNDGRRDQPACLIVRANVSPEVFQFIPAIVGFFGLAAAITLISVLSANRADPFAILIAD